jgi:hypothetical protein
MSAHFGLAAANVFPAVRKHFFTLRRAFPHMRWRLSLTCGLSLTLSVLGFMLCREQGPQGRDVYQAYASGLFLFFALWEVS